MKVRYAESTSCPNGQFVIEAESETEGAILAAFLSAPGAGYAFRLHGITHADGRTESFNFGWSRPPPTGTAT